MRRLDDGVSIDEVNQAWEIIAAANGVENDDDLKLEGTDATKYRSVTARLNYIGPDRVDIQYATKEAARHMAEPRLSHMTGLRKIGKYLAGRPRLISHFKWQSPHSTVTAYTDSDWAGCMVTAKSTSGGIMSIGVHIIKTYSRQQETVALSSAEAELHAMVAASVEALGIIGLCQDLGMRMSGEVLADSSAALGISNRSGSGKVRHLRIQALWAQEVRSTGRLGYKKVLGTLNPSDILTKPVPGDLLDDHTKRLWEWKSGSSRHSPAVTCDHVSTYVRMVRGTKSTPKRRNVHFDEDGKCKGIPAAGRHLPTRSARKTRCAWKDLVDEERDVDSVTTQFDGYKYIHGNETNAHDAPGVNGHGGHRQRVRLHAGRAQRAILFLSGPEPRARRESSQKDWLPRGTARRDRDRGESDSAGRPPQPAHTRAALAQTELHSLSARPDRKNTLERNTARAI